MEGGIRIDILHTPLGMISEYQINNQKITDSTYNLEGLTFTFKNYDMGYYLKQRYENEFCEQNVHDPDEDIFVLHDLGSL